jgi:hypothetical protein
LPENSQTRLKLHERLVQLSFANVNLINAIFGFA